MAERVETVGRVHPHAEAKVIGPAGETLPIGVQGEYCSRGYAVMPGYWDDPHKTAEAIDAMAGCIRAISRRWTRKAMCASPGRIKDMIIRGGENIYRARSRSSCCHPRRRRCAGVWRGRCQVWRGGLRVDHRQAGRNAGEPMCRSIARAASRIQGAAHIRIVERFAMTVTGKAQKFEMRKVMEAEIAAERASSQRQPPERLPFARQS
jgi:fatty-acyl-CoA synthase